MVLTLEQASEIANDIKGTCFQTIDDVAFENFGILTGTLTIEDYLVVEEDVFLCDSCGWWCETPSDEGKCTECVESDKSFEDEDEDEDEAFEGFCDGCGNDIADCECDE